MKAPVVKSHLTLAQFIFLSNGKIIQNGLGGDLLKFP